jgi:hypothetical protein
VRHLERASKAALKPLGHSRFIFNRELIRHTAFRLFSHPWFPQ